MRRTRLQKPAAIPVEQYQINEGLHTVLLCPYCCEFVADDWLSLPDRCPLCGQSLTAPKEEP